MSITSPLTATGPASRLARSLAVPTIVAGAGAAVCTTGIAVAVHAGGVPLAVGGQMIPLAGFSQMTLLGALIGGILLAVFNRRSVAPRVRFLQATAALGLLSCGPAVAWPPDAATRATLVTLHLLAAGDHRPRPSPPRRRLSAASSLRP